MIQLTFIELYSELHKCYVLLGCEAILQQLPSSTGFWKSYSNLLTLCFYHILRYSLDPSFQLGWDVTEDENSEEKDNATSERCALDPRWDPEEDGEGLWSQS